MGSHNLEGNFLKLIYLPFFIYLFFQSIAATVQIAPPRDFKRTHYYDRVKFLLTPPV